jgi:DNA-binding LacI/PurR family transcriptional regulator
MGVKIVYKYQEIAFELEKRICSGHYPANVALPPETLLAKEFEVSHLTLRKAMDLLVQNKRVVRRRGSGTFLLNSGAKKNRQSLKETVILYAGDTESDFFRELYLAIARESQEAGCEIFTCNPQSAQLSTIRKYIADSTCIIGDKALLDFVRNEKVSLAGKNLICVDIYYEGDDSQPSYAICCDVFQATRIATEYLIDLGHEKIAFISAPDRQNQTQSFMVPAADRRTYLGFQSAFISRNALSKMSSCMGTSGNSTAQHSDAILQWLKQLDHFPTAFVCEGDFRAAALIRAASKLGKRNPADFSVIGTGNTQWCDMITPTLSSVYMGERDMAELAIALAGRPAPKTRHLFKTEPKLVLRESTAKYKQPQ